MVVWKYELDIKQNQLVHMPVDAVILSVAVSDSDYPCIYAATSGSEAKTAARIFSIVTTGEQFEPYDNFATPLINQYLGTVTLGKLGGWYVAHVFEGYMKNANNKVEDRQELQQELRDE